MDSHVRGASDLLFISTKFNIQRSQVHGWGVFANTLILEGELIEECHFVRLPETDWNDVDPALQEYAFAWPRGSEGSFAIAFGAASCYNHSPSPNIDWSSDEDKRVIRFVAIKDIDIGEELCHDYGQPYWITHEENHG